MKDLASHIMDIVQNSVRAEAQRIGITITEDSGKDVFTIEISDNGCGMDAETVKRVSDPFFTSRTVRKVGLGIPLLQQNAERTGGKLTITSAPGEGTILCACFSHVHIDRPPLGDIADTIGLLIAANPHIHFIYTHITERGEYIFDSEEIKSVIEGVPLNHPDILAALKEMIRENLTEIGADQNESKVKRNLKS